MPLNCADVHLNQLQPLQSYYDILYGKEGWTVLSKVKALKTSFTIDAQAVANQHPWIFTGLAVLVKIKFKNTFYYNGYISLHWVPIRVCVPGLRKGISVRWITRLKLGISRDSWCSITFSKLQLIIINNNANWITYLCAMCSFVHFDQFDQLDQFDQFDRFDPFYQFDRFDRFSRFDWFDRLIDLMSEFTSQTARNQKEVYMQGTDIAYTKHF